jgi:hypothetical protein
VHPLQQHFQQHGPHVSERAVDPDIQERYHPEGYCSADVGYGPARTQAPPGNQLYEPEMSCGTSTAPSSPPSAGKPPRTAKESNMMPQMFPVGGPQEEATTHSGTYFSQDVGCKALERK